MRSATLGKVPTRAKIENAGDLYLVTRGDLPRDQVRSVEVGDALVDTGATILSMPKRLIQQLGLTPLRKRTAAGTAEVQVYGPVRLTVQDRDFPTDVTELPDGCSVLIGQIALEALDLVVDPVGQRLIGNPAHGGEHIIELY